MDSAATVACADDEKAFIQFVVETIHKENKGYSSLRVDKVDKAARGVDAMKKYRNKFGNMEGCLKSPATALVIEIKDSVAQLRSQEDFDKAVAAGVITDGCKVAYEAEAKAYAEKQALFNS